MWRIVLCLTCFTSTAVKFYWFLKSTISCKRSVARFGLKLPVYSITGDHMFLIFPYLKMAVARGVLFILPLNYFFILHHRPFIFFGPLWWKTLALGIYAFTHIPELFKCEALLAMPQNVYYQKVSSYRLLNGKDMIICRDQIYFFW